MRKVTMLIGGLSALLSVATPALASKAQTEQSTATVSRGDPIRPWKVDAASVSRGDPIRPWKVDAASVSRGDPIRPW